MRHRLRRNILVPRSYLETLESGEIKDLLTELKTGEVTSSRSKMIRRKLRRLGFKLREHVGLKAEEKDHGLYIKPPKILEEITEEEKVSPPPPSEKPTTVLRKRREIRRRGVDIPFDQVRDTAEKLILAGYKTKGDIVDRLLELYPKIDEKRATIAAELAWGESHPVSKKELREASKAPWGGRFEPKKNPGRVRGYLIDRLFDDWRREEVLDDRREYDKDDLQSGLPGFRKEEIDEIYRRLHRSLRRNPAAHGGEVIYDKIIAIEAQKGSDSNFPKDKFRHDFKGKTEAKVIGMPDGSLKIVGKKPLWKKFEYDN